MLSIELGPLLVYLFNAIDVSIMIGMGCVMAKIYQFLEVVI